MRKKNKDITLEIFPMYSTAQSYTRLLRSNLINSLRLAPDMLGSSNPMLGTYRSSNIFFLGIRTKGGEGKLIFLEISKHV